jgi:hypothetical protein
MSFCEGAKGKEGEENEKTNSSFDCSVNGRNSQRGGGNQCGYGRSNRAGGRQYSDNQYRRD